MALSDGVVVDHNRWDLFDLYNRLLAEYGMGLELKVHRLRAQLFLLLEKALEPTPIKTGQFSHEQLETLRNIVQQSESLRLNIKDLAAELHINQDHFSRVFKRTFGYAPRIWLARERIHRIADDLQHSSLTLDELAHAYGYPDVYSFGKQFRKFIGVSPGRYRQMKGNLPRS